MKSLSKAMSKILMKVPPRLMVQENIRHMAPRKNQGTHSSVENQPVDSIGNRWPAATTAAHRFSGEGMGERIAPISEPEPGSPVRP